MKVRELVQAGCLFDEVAIYQVSLEDYSHTLLVRFSGDAETFPEQYGELDVYTFDTCDVVGHELVINVLK